MRIIEDFKANFYKDGTKEWHYGKIVSSIIFISVLVSIGLFNREKKKQLEHERSLSVRYTTGVTKNSYHNFRSSQPSVKYSFVLFGKEYKGFEPIRKEFEHSVNAKGGRYYVEFASENPANCKLLLERAVPDSVLYAPDSGWVNIPPINNVQQEEKDDKLKSNFN